ncbi:MAG: hypothetical protein MHM6MM_009121 [Cercozoa sp. M6MM]
MTSIATSHGHSDRKLESPRASESLSPSAVTGSSHGTGVARQANAVLASPQGLSANLSAPPPTPEPWYRPPPSGLSVAHLQQSQRYDGTYQYGRDHSKEAEASSSGIRLTNLSTYGDGWPPRREQHAPEENQDEGLTNEFAVSVNGADGERDDERQNSPDRTGVDVALFDAARSRMTDWLRAISVFEVVLVHIVGAVETGLVEGRRFPEDVDAKFNR